jgi:hypothetical protein
MKTNEISENALSTIASKYNDFKFAVTDRDLNAFKILEEIRNLEKVYADINIIIEHPKSIDDLFSPQEKESIYKDCWIMGVENIAYCGDSISIESIHNQIRSFLSKLEYKPSPEVAGFVFCELMKKHGIEAYTFSMSELFNEKLKEGYFPITKEVAQELVKSRNYTRWNGKLVFDKISMPGKDKDAPWQEYYAIKTSEVDELFAKADQIYLYGQHSYYSYVSLGDIATNPKK